MAKFRVGLDIDGCLADFNIAYNKLLTIAESKDRLPAGWEEKYPECIICWDWDKEYGYSEAARKQAIEVVRESGDFWYHLPELDETQLVLDTLNYMVHADEIDLYFITTRGGIRAKQQTEMWLIDRGIMTPTVIISDNKVPVLQGLKLDFYIDDRLQTVEDAHKAGCPGVHLLDRPWNRVGRSGDLRVAYSVAEALFDAELWVDLSAV